ncbi:hypothetical protein ACFQV2_17710 [Actinokineospora soli]|uniref:Phenylalanine-tRNA ligase class II N-terminal domain-containing protein n=1 Tax=Actinokineospora soli TaxID=1048753 RepID=A0ABW2TRA1_9PSEU
MSTPDGGTTLLDRVQHTLAKAHADLAAATTSAEVAAVRREQLGKSGALPVLRRALGGLDPDARKAAGAALHAAQQDITAALDAKERALLDAEPALPHPIDVTVPGLRPARAACTRPPSSPTTSTTRSPR